MIKTTFISPRTAVLRSGDFDSLKVSLPPDIPTVTLPVKKDVTDMDAAVNEGIKRGYESFEIYGGMGGRPDHTMANISLLARLSQDNKSAVMYGAGFSIAPLTDGRMTVNGEDGKTVSVFSWTDISEGVSIKGLKYEADNIRLTSSFALGVSNSFTGQKAEISVKKTLIIMTENNS